jgi:hypothetical protein
MKNNKNINLVSIVSILVLLIGFVLSLVSYFFNKILPVGIISSDFPPFYLFFIGMVFLTIGFFLFFFKKIQNIGRKRIGIVITLIVIFFIILSLPIVFRSLTISTGRFILSEDVVWQANESIATETEAQDLFKSHIMEFWETSLNILRDSHLSYPDNAVPLLEQMRVYSTESYSSMNKWGIIIPVIPEGADWNIGFFDGYVEVFDEGRWHDTGYIFFNVEKELGVVRVEV